MNENRLVADPRTISRSSLAPGSSARNGGRALVWDAANTSALMVARALRRQGWTVDWLGGAASPWWASSAFDGERTILSGPEDPRLQRVLWEHPLDALFLSGDDHVRWMLEHWSSLPPGVHRHLSDPGSLRTALSKERSLQLAEKLGVPTLPTLRCTSPADVAELSRRLAPGGEVVIKGEGGAAGAAVASVRAGETPGPETWRRVTRFSPVVLVQRRVRGPRVFIVVVYEHGVERAACLHEKVATFPHDFGVTAYGITRHIEPALEQSRRMFEALCWHGVANIEFRQDLHDGQYYFMEINPRVNASMGIQDRAGIDIAGTWTNVCTGRGGENPPGRAYRDGVRYVWGVRGLALAISRPWRVPAWGWRSLLGENTDLAALDAPLRRRALRLAFWLARHA